MFSSLVYRSWEWRNMNFFKTTFTRRYQVYFIGSRNLNLTAMRSFMLSIDQRLHFTDLLVRVERYGQLALFLFASGVIGYLYIILQGMLANYLATLELSQIPIY